MEITTRTTCRVCGWNTLVPLFSLGEQCVSNFVDPSEVNSGVKCPIELQLCTHCTLVQMRHTAPQELLYSRHYWYKSGVTDTMRQALRDVTAAAEDRVKLNPGDVVLDIGSNDGTLLRSYSVPGIIRIGVEPARNLAVEGREGIERLVTDFWPMSTGVITSLKAGLGVDLFGDRSPTKAKIITACGMFYDLEDPGAFIADVAAALHPDGVFIAQLMCLKQTVKSLDVGNFAHEHLEFYSLKSLQYLFEANGLVITDIEENTVNGGSYRIFAKLQESAYCLNGAAIQAFFDEEEAMQLAEPATYNTFFQQLEANKKSCIDFIQHAVNEGKRVWVYGASTKGNVILQFYSLDHTLISGAADRSPAKWGKVTIGSGIKIYSEDEARKEAPEFFLVLPYSFREEFIQREIDWLCNGGKFLIPLPKFQVIGYKDIEVNNGLIESSKAPAFLRAD